MHIIASVFGKFMYTNMIYIYEKFYWYMYI
jgi:hypothetical protein